MTGTAWGSVAWQRAGTYGTSITGAPLAHHWRTTGTPLAHRRHGKRQKGEGSDDEDESSEESSSEEEEGDGQGGHQAGAPRGAVAHRRHFHV